MARRLQAQHRRSPSNKTWTGLSASAYTLVNASSKVLLGSFSLSNPGIDETLLRVRGMFSVKSDQVATSEDQLGSIGMILVTDTALGVGITAIPGPSADDDDDGWFIHSYFAQHFHLLTAAGFVNDLAKSYPFESKAKRKVHDGNSIAIVAENTHATHALSIAVQFRVLSMVTGT